MQTLARRSDMSSRAEARAAAAPAAAYLGEGRDSRAWRWSACRGVDPRDPAAVVRAGFGAVGSVLDLSGLDPADRVELAALADAPAAGLDAAATARLRGLLAPLPRLAVAGLDLDVVSERRDDPEAERQAAHAAAALLAVVGDLAGWAVSRSSGGPSRHLDCAPLAPGAGHPLLGPALLLAVSARVERAGWVPDEDPRHSATWGGRPLFWRLPAAPLVCLDLSPLHRDPGGRGALFRCLGGSKAGRAPKRHLAGVATPPDLRALAPYLAAAAAALRPGRDPRGHRPSNVARHVAALRAADHPVPARLERAAAVVATLPAGHRVALALAGLTLTGGLTADHARALLARLPRRSDDGYRDSAQVVESTLVRLAAGNSVTGWGALASCVGAQRAAALERALLVDLGAPEADAAAIARRRAVGSRPTRAAVEVVAARVPADDPMLRELVAARTCGSMVVAARVDGDPTDHVACRRCRRTSCLGCETLLSEAGARLAAAAWAAWAEAHPGHRWAVLDVDGPALEAGRAWVDRALDLSAVAPDLGCAGTLGYVVRRDATGRVALGVRAVWAVPAASWAQVGGVAHYLRSRLGLPAAAVRVADLGAGPAAARAASARFAETRLVRTVGWQLVAEATADAARADELVAHARDVHGALHRRQRARRPVAPGVRLAPTEAYPDGAPPPPPHWLAWPDREQERAAVRAAARAAAEQAAAAGEELAPPWPAPGPGVSFRLERARDRAPLSAWSDYPAWRAHVVRAAEDALARDPLEPELAPAIGLRDLRPPE